MTIWIGLGEFRPVERSSEVEIAGLFQFVAGPAPDGDAFAAGIGAHAQENGWFLIGLEYAMTLDQFRAEGRVETDDLAEFVDKVETEEALTFGPGYSYIDDDA